MVKNLYVIMPEIPVMARRVRVRFTDLSSSFLARLFRKYSGLRRRISIIDLTLLKDTLAIQLRKCSKRMIRISDKTRFRYEKINIGGIMEKQNQLLRDLLSEQQTLLRKQSQEIIEHERNRIREKYSSGAGNR
jgi:hypothetical protein